MADVTIPEPWAEALIRAGMTDPRYADRDIPSLGRLSEATRATGDKPVHKSTLSAMVTGRKRTEPEVVERVAQALGVDIVKVSAWVRRSRTVREPWRPPAAVNSLTAREQRAITEIILAMAESRGELVGHESAPIVTEPEPVGGHVPTSPGEIPKPLPRSGQAASRRGDADSPSRAQRRRGTNHGGT